MPGPPGSQYDPDGVEQADVYQMLPQAGGSMLICGNFTKYGTATVHLAAKVTTTRSLAARSRISVECIFRRFYRLRSLPAQ